MTEQEVIASHDKTLELTQKILTVALANSGTDLLRSAQACANSLLLLGRLVHYQDNSEERLLSNFPEAEEERVNELLLAAEPFVLETTGGKPPKYVLHKLLQAVRHQQQARVHQGRRHARNRRPKQHVRSRQQ